MTILREVGGRHQQQGCGCDLHRRCFAQLREHSCWGVLMGEWGCGERAFSGGKCLEAAYSSSALRNNVSSRITFYQVVLILIVSFFVPFAFALFSQLDCFFHGQQHLHRMTMPRRRWTSGTGQGERQGCLRSTSTKGRQSNNEDKTNVAPLLETASILDVEGKTTNGYPASKYELPATEESFSTYLAEPADGDNCLERDRYGVEAMHHYRISHDSAIDVSEETLCLDKDIKDLLLCKFVNDSGVSYSPEIILNDYSSVSNEGVDIVPFLSTNIQFPEIQYDYSSFVEYNTLSPQSLYPPPLPDLDRLHVPVSGIHSAKSPGSAHGSSLSSASGTFSSIATSDAANDGCSPYNREPSASPFWIPTGASPNQAGSSLATPIIIISDEDCSDSMDPQSQASSLEDAAFLNPFHPLNQAPKLSSFNGISENSVPLIHISNLGGTSEIIKPNRNNGFYRSVETQTESLLTAPVLQGLDLKDDCLDGFKPIYLDSSITLKTPPGKSEVHEQKPSNQAFDCPSLSSHPSPRSFLQDNIGTTDLKREYCTKIPEPLTSINDLEDYSEAETDDSFEDDGSTTTTSSHRIVSLSPPQQQLHDDLMRVFWERHNAIDFTAYQGLRARTNGSSQPPASSYGTNHSSSSQTGPLPSSNSSTPVSTNLKRRREDDERDPREGQAKEPKFDVIISGQEKPAFPLACQFRKHNPQKYCLRDYEVCANHSWDQIHRLKGHIYRNHGVQIHCPRCGVLFDKQGDLDLHLTLTQICDLRPSRPVEGITPAMEKQLRSRKKASLTQTPEEQWQSMYRILFPNDKRILSPYFEQIPDHSAQSSSVADPDTTLFEYIRTATPRIFISLLRDRIRESDVDNASNNMSFFYERLGAMMTEAQEAARVEHENRSLDMNLMSAGVLSPPLSNSTPQANDPNSVPVPNAEISAPMDRLQNPTSPNMFRSTSGYQPARSNNTFTQTPDNPRSSPQHSGNQADQIQHHHRSNTSPRSSGSELFGLSFQQQPLSATFDASTDSQNAAGGGNGDDGQLIPLAQFFSLQHDAEGLDDSGYFDGYIQDYNQGPYTQISG